MTLRSFAHQYNTRGEKHEMHTKLVSSKLALAVILALAVCTYVCTSVLAEQPATVRHHFSFNGKRPVVDQEGKVLSGVALTAEDTEGRLTFQDEIWKPGFNVVPHFHKKHFEVFYVVSGQIEWTVAGETHLMGAGDLVYIPAKTIHAVHVVGDKEAHLLFIYEPGGYEDQMARDASYTPEQLKDPKIRKEVRRLDDFNPVDDQ
jgi:quercetin dioxygenase-like cupin family protein